MVTPRSAFGGRGHGGLRQFTSRNMHNALGLRMVERSYVADPFEFTTVQRSNNNGVCRADGVIGTRNSVAWRLVGHALGVHQRAAGGN